MTDTQRRIELAGMMSRYYHLCWMRAALMCDAVEYYSKGEDKDMWISLLDWAAAEKEKEEWWQAKRFKYLRGIEVVGGWK